MTSTTVPLAAAVALKRVCLFGATLSAATSPTTATNSAPTNTSSSSANPTLFSLNPFVGEISPAASSKRVSQSSSAFTSFAGGHDSRSPSLSRSEASSFVPCHPFQDSTHCLVRSTEYFKPSKRRRLVDPRVDTELRIRRFKELKARRREREPEREKRARSSPSQQHRERSFTLAQARSNPFQRHSTTSRSQSNTRVRLIDGMSSNRLITPSSTRAFSLFRSSPTANAPSLNSTATSSTSSNDSSVQNANIPPPHYSPSTAHTKVEVNLGSFPSAQTRTVVSAPSAAQHRDDPKSNHFPAEDPTQDINDRRQQDEIAPPRPELYSDQINTLLRHPTLYDPVLKPRNPIVLCHGLYGFDVKGPSYFRLHYWGDLLSILRGTVGAEVIVTAVPGTGSIKQRAHSLHRLLQENDDVKGKELNFLAHSMGGLDARYLFSQIRPDTYHPLSLTTLSTPHRGSEFMAWCRANIGIGTDYDATSAEAARLAHEDNSIPLPFSLKSPILTRAQVAEKKKADDDAKKVIDEEKKKAEASASGKLKSVLSLTGLPKTLSAGLSNYLLELLDSPAYANLTPAFLREVFNPLTPNRDDIKYYSVASKTDKIPIWHPLWLPKQVLDGAESARQSKGIQPRPEWIGNDGLVTIESAQWGEFLGVIDNCDHWEMRGSSGLVSAAASAKAMAELGRAVTGTTEKNGTSETYNAGASSNSNSADKAKFENNGNGEKKGWVWQDLYQLVGSSRNKSPIPSPAAIASAVASSVTPSSSPSSAKESPTSNGKDDGSSLASIASWIVRVLPGVSSKNGSSTGPASATVSNKSPTAAPPLVVSDPRHGSIANSTRASDIDTKSALNGSGTTSAHARMQYGAPVSSASSSGASNAVVQNGGNRVTAAEKKVEKDKFSLERMTVAICRKLYNDGL